MIDRIDLLAVIGRHLILQAEGKPPLLAVDDMHLLDPHSARWFTMSPRLVPPPCS